MSSRELRRDYMRNEGFALVTDVGHQFMHDSRHVSISPVDAKNAVFESGTVNPSAAALGLVAIGLCGELREMAQGNTFRTAYSVNVDDLSHSNNRFAFAGGLGDQDFTWHFSAAIANTVAEEFDKQGYITTKDRTKMTLGDWADVIGSVWFSDLMHDMALTNNGRWGGIGLQAHNYQDGAFWKTINWDEKRPAMPLFEVGSKYSEAEDTTYLTAKVTNEYRRELRKGMKDNGTPGCPVARHAGTISLELMREDPHAKRLVRDGHLRIVEEHEDRVRFTQDYTPIDRALDAFAGLLDQYDARFGTPYWYDKATGVAHEHRPRSNVLIRKGDVPFRN